MSKSGEYHRVITAWSIFIFSLSIRLIFIWVGVALDNWARDGCSIRKISDLGLCIPIQYTDVDYNIYCDAAREVYARNSPYERSTYRYPPLLAWLLVPVVYYEQYGKVLFSVADSALASLLYLYSLLLFPTTEFDHTWLRLVRWGWVLNPISINICTRGSSDSVTNCFTILVLYLIERSRRDGAMLLPLRCMSWAGAVYGALVYMRIYPVILYPAIVVNLFHKSSDKCSLKECFYSAMTFTGWASLTGVFFFLVSVSFYGGDYISEAIWYHVVRSDHRHNFSLHFYWMYLLKYDVVNATAGGILPWSLVLRVILPLPQLLLFAMITYKYAAQNLSACALLLTMVLVAFNKVITAQYFTWYMCLLPLVMPTLLKVEVRSPAPVEPMGGKNAKADKAAGPRAKSGLLLLIVCIIWVVATAWWLWNGYLLEFNGAHKFQSVWLASITFHATNTLMIALLVVCIPVS